MSFYLLPKQDIEPERASPVGLIKNSLTNNLDASGSISMVSKNETLVELGNIFEKDYGQKLSEDQLTDIAERLLRLTELVLKHEGKLH